MAPDSTETPALAGVVGCLLDVATASREGLP